MIILPKMKQYSDGIKAANEGQPDPTFLAGMEMAFLTGATTIALLVTKAIEECSPENCTQFFQSLKAEADAIASTVTTRSALHQMQQMVDEGKPQDPNQPDGSYWGDRKEDHE